MEQIAMLRFAGVIGVVVSIVTPCAAQIPESLTAAQRVEVWVRQSPTEPLPANLSFGRLVSDEQAVQLVRRNGVTPVAIYMYADGLWATHRVSIAKASAASIPEARRNVIEMMRKGLRSAQPRAQRLTQEAAAGAVRDDAADHRNATSFLAVIERERSVIRSAVSGKPMIYAIDVIGDASSIRSIMADALVASAEPAFKVDGRTRVPRARPPSNALRGFEAPAINALTTQDALARIRDIARNGVREEP